MGKDKAVFILFMPILPWFGECQDSSGVCSDGIGCEEVDMESNMANYHGVDKVF